MGDPLSRISGAAGILGAVTTLVFGALHPKGSRDVGSVSEWMTRVGASDAWVLIHFMLLLASILGLVALVGVARSYPEGSAQAWARIGVLVATVATAIAVMTFLIDGAVVKETADRWVAGPQEANSGDARLATDIGFVLVAGLQLATGFVATIFAIAGLRSPTHPPALAWMALAAGSIGVISGAAHYLLGSSTWAANATYVSSGLFGIWVLAMSRRLWLSAPRAAEA